MNLIERVKNILITPAKEWDVIAAEQPDTGKIITGYVLPLAGAAALAAFLGYSLVASLFGGGLFGTTWGLFYALISLIRSIGMVFISALIIDALAPTFGAEKNFGRTIQLVAYSCTPFWIGGLLAIIPILALIGVLAGLYGFYLLFIGLPKMKKNPEDKQVGYFVVSLLTMIIVYAVIEWILTLILLSAFGLSFLRPGIL